jgi:hypothetical protein
MKIGKPLTEQMIIDEKKGYWIGNRVFPTREEAQLSAITDVISGAGGDTWSGEDIEKIATLVMNNKTSIISVLTGTKPRKPRSDKGKSHAPPAPEKKAEPEKKPKPEKKAAGPKHDVPDDVPGVKVEASTKYANK